MSAADMGWLDQVVRITMSQRGYLLFVKVQAFNKPMASNVTATFEDDAVIGRIMNGRTTIAPRGSPTSNVPIVEPPTTKMKQAYRKWRFRPTITFDHPGEGATLYTVDYAGAYFDLTKLKTPSVHYPLTCSGLIFEGNPEVIAISATLYSPKGVELASDATGTAGLPDTAVITINASIDPPSVDVARPDD